MAKQGGVTPTQIACAWILQAPGVTAPIIGATKTQHLEEIFAAVDIKLSAEEANRGDEGDLDAGGGRVSRRVCKLLWSYPKPLQQPHPPTILGTLSTKGPHRLVRYCDGWVPTGVKIEDLSAAIRDLHTRAEQAEREPGDVPISIFGAPTEEAVLRRYQELRVERVVLTVPSREKDQVLPLLDTYARLAAKFI